MSPDLDANGLTFALPRARVVFTGRPHDVRAEEERCELEAGLGVRLALAHQVHGTRVVAAGAAAEEADGVWTDRTGIAPAVVVADCLPVALAGPRGVAMLHCGWRGLAGGIVAEGVAALGGEVTAAAIGPGAGPCCYEVGDEVAAHFEPAARAGRHLDLPGVARRRLEAAGVGQVEEAGVCTICGDPGRWFSYRREGPGTGRQAGVVWRA